MIIKPTEHVKKLLIAGQMQPGGDKCDAWIPCNGLRITQEGFGTKFEFLHEGNPVAEFTWTGRVSDNECLTVMAEFELRLSFNLTL